MAVAIDISQRIDSIILDLYTLGKQYFFFPGVYSPDEAQCGVFNFFVLFGPLSC